VRFADVSRELKGEGEAGWGLGSGVWGAETKTKEAALFHYRRRGGGERRRREEEERSGEEKRGVFPPIYVIYSRAKGKG
jgi:hypothetical protein